MTTSISDRKFTNREVCTTYLDATAASVTINHRHLTSIPYQAHEFIHKHIFVIGSFINSDGIPILRRINRVLNFLIIRPWVIVHIPGFPFRFLTSRSEHHQEHCCQNNQKQSDPYSCFSNFHFNHSPCFLPSYSLFLQNIPPSFP